jgi:hypothetical protein
MCVCVDYGTSAGQKGSIDQGHRPGGWSEAAPSVPSQTTLQLLYGPQIIPDVRDRLDSDALVHSLHLFRPELRDPNPDRELLALRVERNGRSRGQRRVRRGKPSARRRQPGTHHVCAREQEADRAAVYADVWEYERIYKKRGRKQLLCEDFITRAQNWGTRGSKCGGILAFVEKTQGG